MNKIDELENKIKLLEQQCSSKHTEMKFIFDTLVTKNTEVEKKIKDNNDKINKLLLIIQELVNQGKLHKDLIEGVSKQNDELKTVSITIDDSIVKMTHSEFAKFVLNKMNPDIKMRKWSDRIRDWGLIIIFIFGIIYLIIQGFLTKNQNEEMRSIMEILKSIKG